jgi:hypothetical protein
MKRIFLVVLLFTASFGFTNAYAQEGFHAGVSGSFNTVWIVNQNAYGGTEYKYKLKLGGGGGVDVGYNFTDHLGFQSGVMYSTQGQNYADSKNTGFIRDYSLDYVCVPLLFKYTGGNSNVKFYAQAGPRFSFLNSASLQGAYQAAYSPGNINENAYLNNSTINGKDRYTPDDVGITFGLGANIGLTKTIYISLGMNFFYSFNDINSNGPTTDPNAYYLKGSTSGTWHWPWYYNNVYSPSRNATGGINGGIHYLIPTGKHHHH